MSHASGALASGMDYSAGQSFFTGMSLNILGNPLISPASRPLHLCHDGYFSTPSDLLPNMYSNASTNLLNAVSAAVHLPVPTKGARRFFVSPVLNRVFTFHKQVS